LISKCAIRQIRGYYEGGVVKEWVRKVVKVMGHGAADPQQALLHPARPRSPEQPTFNSIRYTVDLLLPAANCWLLHAAIVAGLSGIFKRD
jgi:hypothetical protein